MKPALLALCSAALVCACGATPPPAVAKLTNQGGTISLPDPETGACHATDVTPAVIQTETEKVIVQEAIYDASGNVTVPAVYTSNAQPVIVEERQEQRFEALCEAQLNAEFIANLQRALSVRGFYKGPASGVMNWRTQRAVRLYQLDQGIDSAILSKQTARALGLTNYENF